MSVVLKFIQNNLATLLGSFLPVLGSVFLIHYGNYADEKKKYQLYFRRFLKLHKYNMEIAYSRIINNTRDIPFTKDDLNQVLSDMENTGMNRSENIYNDIFDLVFAISAGEQLTMTFSDFYKIVFEQTRKSHANFLELAKIIDSVGIEQVYEFKVLRMLILLAQKLEIETTFDHYYHLVKSIERDIHIETVIRYYLVELINQHHYGASNKVYYIQYALDSYKITDQISTIKQTKEDMQDQKEINKIIKQMTYYQDIIHTFHKDTIWSTYLENITEESITVKSKHIDKINQKLKELFNSDEDIYLSFLGICANGDALDNNGRSRQKEYLDKKRSTPYIVIERGWYKEALLDDQNHVTITYPYVDTSKSYVVSFVKKIYLQDEIKGVLGLDVVVDELVDQVMNDDDRKLILFTYEGEIIYDNMNRSSKKLFFNNIFLKNGINMISLIKNNNNGYLKMNNQKLYFATIVKNKYYCIVYED